MADDTFPVQHELRAHRGAPYRRALSVEGVNLAGAGLRMQIRKYPDAPDPALVTLTKVSTAVQGLQLDIETGGGLPITNIIIRIDALTLLNLEPFATNGTEPGQLVGLSYDILVTPTDDIARFWWAGEFQLFPGVTKGG